MIAIDVQGQLSGTRKLKLLKLPPVKRRRLLANIGRKLRVANRKRLRQQRNIDGSKFAARADGSKQKQFRKLGRKIRNKSTADAATLYFQGGNSGLIARQHQDGVQQSMTAGQAKKAYGTPDYSAPATRKQARALKNEGYKIQVKGGRFKRATIKHIVSTMTLGQAGLVLRIMRDEKPKQRWTIALPPRDMLGANSNDINSMVNAVFDQTIKAKA